MTTIDSGDPGRAARAAARRATILPALVMLIYSIIIGRIPLLNYLGYEYAVAVALITPIIPGLFFLRIFDGKGGAWARATTLAAPCLAIPLVTGLLNAFLVKNCALAEGIAWYALLPVAGMAWVLALAYFCASAFRRPTAWFLLCLAGVMLHPFLLGYFTPRVDSYNFVYGYFTGFTYDEDLRITRELIHWRVLTLLCALGLAAAGGMAAAARAGRAAAAEPGGGGPRIGSPIRAAILVLCIAGLTAAWLYRTDLGFETTASSLRRTLGSMAATRHFRIYYDSAAMPADEVRWMAAEHEFRFDQVSRFLMTDTGRVIESYIYPDETVKRRLIGAGNTDIAKPWRGEIHMDAGAWRFTLKHELAHALASEFGMPVVRANVNIGLVEGLAMAASPSFGDRSLQEYAASMIRFGIVEDPAGLIRPAGFAFQASTVSYVLMGAFCQHLVARYGIGPLKAWYGGAPAGDAYGRDPDALIAEWRRSLDSIVVPEEWREHTDYYFRRGSIFARECARRVANLNSDGDAALERKDFPGAMRFYVRALEESWNASSFAGLLRSLMGSHDFDAVVRLFGAEQGDTLRKGSIAGVKLLYGDALMMKGDLAAARDVYREIRRLSLSPGMNEAVALRLAAADAPDIGEYVAPVIAGTMEDSAALEWLAGIPGGENAALLSYLRGRVRLERRDYVGAAQETAEYFEPFAYPELNGALGDVAATAFFRLGDFFSARVFFERTLDYNPGAALLLRVRDRRERCLWFEREWGGLGVEVSRVAE